MNLNLLGFTSYIHTAKSIKSLCRLLGLRAPAAVTSMYLVGESAEYIAAAVLSVNSVGA